MSRVETLKKLMLEAKLDAAVIVPGPNFFYLTGLTMHLSERITMAVFPVQGEAFVICPKLEAEKIRRITGIEKTYPWADEDGPQKAAHLAFKESNLSGKNIACEYRATRLLEWDLILKALENKVKINPLDAILNQMRTVKDEQEIAFMEKAVLCVEEALKAAQTFMKPGVKELEIAALLESTIQKFGGSGGGSVISGERGCLPHAITSDKALAVGETVILDIVAKYKGYTADITRTFAIGKLPDELSKIYQIVLEAQTYARAHSKPGMTGEELDALARDKITEAGYGEYFIHRSGHGLGLETHEEPYVVKGNQVPFVVGNAFTIEPGIYVPGLGGVRIEDDAVMIPGGVKILTHYPRELIVLE
jgi:Xaa-Pro aminopeptidase